MKRNVSICLLVLLVAAISAGCSQSPEKVTPILKREGYENIEVTGYKMFGCGEDDDLTTGFNATKNGYEVSGVVCSSWFSKGTVVRTFD